MRLDMPRHSFIFDNVIVNAGRRSDDRRKEVRDHGNEEEGRQGGPQEESGEEVTQALRRKHQ
jgi:hypothetical protein